MSGVNVLAMFAGGDIGQQALKNISYKINEYYTAENNKYANEVALKNHPFSMQLGCVRMVRRAITGSDAFIHRALNCSFISDETKEHLGMCLDIRGVQINLLTAGSPCQDLSGLKENGKGLQGESSKLFFEFLILKNHFDKDSKEKGYEFSYFLENVRPRKKAWLDDISECMGVEPIFINSDLFVQQNRPRYYWTNIEIDLSRLPTRPDWKGDYYQWRRTYFRKNQSGVCPCLTANMGTGGHNVPLLSEDKDDKVPIDQLEVLQGYPVGYTEGVSRSQRLILIGNSWTMDVIEFFYSFLPNQ
jgi:site-specific DNA-cytosine methylase